MRFSEDREPIAEGDARYYQPKSSLAAPAGYTALVNHGIIRDGDEVAGSLNTGGWKPVPAEWVGRRFNKRYVRPIRRPNTKSV